MTEELPEITIFTDGSCSPNPGNGGWAAVLVAAGEKSTIKGAEKETTNNRMELTAALKGLQYLDKPHVIKLHTDSKYVKDGITQWLPRWRDRGWTTITGEQVANQDLWQALAQEMERHSVQWSWVKGHGSNELNNLADQLAASAREKCELPLADKDAVHIFLAITWRQKLGGGGWGGVLQYRDNYKIIGGVTNSGTGNSLHISSASEALKHLKRAVPVHLYTTSGYLKDGASHWLKQWQMRDWLTKEGLDVSNRTEWQELASLLRLLKVSFHQVDKDNPPCHLQEAKEIAREIFAEDFTG